MPKVDRIADPGGTRTPYGRGERRPVRVDSFLADGVGPDERDAWVPTASILHSDGDAMDIALEDGRMVGVRGRGDSRVNLGRPGQKDLSGRQANGSPDRLTRPLVRRDGGLEECDGDEHMELMVARSRPLGRVAATAGGRGDGVGEEVGR